MKYLLIVIILISNQIYAINAQIFDEVKLIESLNVSIVASHDNKRQCFRVDLGVNPTHAFYQGEDGEASGVEGYVEKQFSGVSLVKYTGKVENAYTLMQMGSEIAVESNLDKDGMHKSSFCVHESDLESSYVLILFTLEQACPELIYIPVMELQKEYVRKT